MAVAFSNWIMVYPQFINPNPAVVANLQFRRALMHATDRQQIAEVVQLGLTPVAHTILDPNQPEYRDIEAAAIRYEYDPRRAAQLIEGLGYTRAPDGWYEPSTNRRLFVELRTSLGDDTQEKSLYSTADYWERSGVGVEVHLIPPQRSRDREYRTTFPGFGLKRTRSDIGGIERLHSSNTPLPENSYMAAGNDPRYINPAFDSIIERLFVTVPKKERLELIAQATLHIAENLNVMGLFYNADPILVSDRIANFNVPRGVRSTVTWNAHEWDIQ